MIRSASRICDKCGKEGGRKRGRITLCDRCKPKSVKPVHDQPEIAAAARSSGCAVKGLVGKLDGKSWVHECSGPVEAHHIQSRGAGGKNAGNTIGLCQRAHQQLHQMGRKSFPLAYGIDLYDEAAAIEKKSR